MPPTCPEIPVILNVNVIVLKYKKNLNIFGVCRTLTFSFYFMLLYLCSREWRPRSYETHSLATSLIELSIGLLSLSLCNFFCLFDLIMKFEGFIVLKNETCIMGAIGRFS